MAQTGRMEPVDAAAVEAAAQRLAHVVPVTPLQRSERLSARVGGEVWLKREDLQVVRSYKVRGAYNLIAQLDEHDRAAGVVCASAGNHGQGLAYACSALGVRGRVYVPRTTPRQKRDRMAALGGDVVTVEVVGDTYDDAAAAALADAARTGAVLVPASAPACVIEASDCRVDPRGLWGPDPAALAPLARTIEQDRGQADRTVRENYRVLSQRAAGPDVRPIVSEQAGFSSERETVCRNYRGEANHGFCNARYTEGRAAQLAARLGLVGTAAAPTAAAAPAPAAAGQPAQPRPARPPAAAPLQLGPQAQ